MKAVLVLIGALCACGCMRPRRFGIRTLMQKPGMLVPGDEIRVAYRNGDHEPRVFTGITPGALHTETGPVPFTALYAIETARLDAARLLKRACAILGTGLGLLVVITMATTA